MEVKNDKILFLTQGIKFAIALFMLHIVKCIIRVS